MSFAAPLRPSNRNYPRDPATHLHPHNNTRLSHLCGPADANLRTIETALSVSIAHRHEQFKVDGTKAKATQAMELIQALYEMAERPIAEEHLQAHAGRRQLHAGGAR